MFQLSFLQKREELYILKATDKDILWRSVEHLGGLSLTVQGNLI